MDSIGKPIDDRSPYEMKEGQIILYPGDFFLMETLESVKIPKDLVGRIEGKSSLGRMGITVHITAGFFDPGFKGRPTLEVKNLHPLHSIKLVPGMKICQMAFEPVMGEVMRPYGSEGLNSHYQGDLEVKGHKAHE